MSVRKIQFIFSLLFLLAYFSLLGIILAYEISDTHNMDKGENSMMGEVKILLGVLTAGVAQILNYWFSSSQKNENNS